MDTRTREALRSKAAQMELCGLPHGGINMAFEAIDRHVGAGRGGHVAIRWRGKRGERRDVSYAELLDVTRRFASMLRALGIGRGDRVFSLLPRVPELHFACLGTLRNGSVFSPLGTASGAEALAARIDAGEGRILVTTDALYAEKIAAVRAHVPSLDHALLLDTARVTPPETLDYRALMAKGLADPFMAPTSGHDIALLCFTSGTTAAPKGTVHVHDAIFSQHTSGRIALDLNETDVFWCTADPGWAAGTTYGILSPLSNGVTCLVDEGDFDPARAYGFVQSERVTVWFTSPDAIRAMMRRGATLARTYDTSSLRLVASMGEPLDAEAVFWGLEAFGLPIHDAFGQAETGAIMIANSASMDIRPGSMGRPLPGIEAAVVRRVGSTVDVVDTPGAEGELAIRRGWPSMFRAYVQDEVHYEERFAGEWYLTGDLARRDADGCFWFIGRADDVITSAGQRIGPFEVESALLEHPAVAEAAVIGKPDPRMIERVKAIVSLRAGYLPSEGLRQELLAFGRNRLGAYVAPREIGFLPRLPRTRSGTIPRRILRARELGLPEGDTSTLENGGILFS